MTGPTAGPPDDDLEQRLYDLGDHLVVDGDGADPPPPVLGMESALQGHICAKNGEGPGERSMAAAVLARLDGASPSDAPSPPAAAGPRARWLVLAAAVVAVLCVGVAAVAPAREAVAGWLGIGAVEIRSGDDPIPSSPPTEPPAADGAGRVDLDAVRRGLPFPLRVPDPDLVGEPSAAVVDPAVPTGLVAIRYGELVLVQMASRPDDTPVASKQLAGGTEVRSVDVGGHSGAWITGAPHQVTYVLPDGQLAVDSVRVAGDVLLWEEGEVTYRIEGARSLAEAVEIATSLR